MKLLIVTQVVDENHTNLSFFLRWIEEFAKHCEQVHVICLEKGEHTLPNNVKIHSLGKEKSQGKIVYLFNFYKLIFGLRKEYDNVFVHMNQIYTILGSTVWHIMKKKVGLWYTHGSVPKSLVVAEKFVDVIFSASPESFRLESKKLFVTGHGIDTQKISPKTVEKDIDLVTVGRITESKNLIELINILKAVRNDHKVSLTVVGGVVTEEEVTYQTKLTQHVKELGLEEEVVFLGMQSREKVSDILNRSKVFVTVAQNGSLDKAILEALATGLPVVSMAPGTKSLMLGDSQVEDSEAFITQLNTVIESSVYMREANVAFVRKNHSIESLIPKILNSY